MESVRFRSVAHIDVYVYSPAWKLFTWNLNWWFRNLTWNREMFPRWICRFSKSTKAKIFSLHLRPRNAIYIPSVVQISHSRYEHPVRCFCCENTERNASRCCRLASFSDTISLLFKHVCFFQEIFNEKFY